MFKYIIYCALFEFIGNTYLGYKGTNSEEFLPNVANINQNEIQVSNPNVNPNWEIEYPNILEDKTWKGFPHLKEVSGLSMSNDGLLYVFHRGDRSWSNISSILQKSCDNLINNNVNQKDNKGNDKKNIFSIEPISQDTVYIINPQNGTIISSWGSNKFYMPHGISVDPEGNIWLTDVALHQVFRYKKSQWDKANLSLGEPFIPGNDINHFCAPTDIAISTSGIVYISDGYCNSRILILSPSGMVLDVIASSERLIIPHSLTLLERENLICVADREDQRIMCYTAGLDEENTGQLAFRIEHPILSRVFAIDHIGDVIFALSVSNGKEPSKGVIIDLATERVLDTWAPENGFFQPHDLTISPDGKMIFTSDIDPKSPKKIYKFTM